MKITNFDSILNDSNSYYSLIIAVSKIARQIVDVANEISGSCPDNPVEEAVVSLKSGEYEIIEPDDF